MSPPLRVALLCHSVNPRGGVVHALELAGALAELGHEPVVHAPAAQGDALFRETAFETVLVEASPYEGGVAEMVRTRAGDYARWFSRPENRRFDVFHAQDGVSGNALADLKADRLISRFVHTVHHLDDFSDPRVAALQRRSVEAADAHMVVSALWRDELRARFKIDAALSGNGVDRRRFRPEPDGREAALGARIGLGAGPVVLCVGGVEARKNTRRTLEAFRQVRRLLDGAQLVIAGGASLLDHDAYRAAFMADLRASGLPEDAVVMTGPLPDADMPALYRIAGALAFPSLKEGFGLTVLEALASGTPVVAPRAAPFTEYLGERDVAWCDPLNPGSIADALMVALSEPMRSRLVAEGFKTAARHDWRRVAEAHLDLYARVLEKADA